MKLASLFGNPSALPVVPRVVQRVLADIAREDVSVRELADLLVADQVLSGKVLRLANSSFYGSPRSVTTVEEAIKMLGFGAVKSLVLSAGLAGGYSAVAGINLPRFWAYSVRTATFGQRLAAMAGCDGEVGYTVGLLSGIGRLVMGAGLGKSLAELDASFGQLPSSPRHQAERDQFGFSFADVGAELCKRWALPETISDGCLGMVEMGDAPKALHASLHIAAWLSLGVDLEIGLPEMHQSWPAAAGTSAGLDVGVVIASLEDFSGRARELSALVV